MKETKIDQKNISFTTLPEDVTSHIATFLTPVELAKLNRVSTYFNKTKYWQALALSKGIKIEGEYKKFFAEHYEREKKYTEAKKILSARSFLSTLKFGNEDILNALKTILEFDDDNTLRLYMQDKPKFFNLTFVKETTYVEIYSPSLINGKCCIVPEEVRDSLCLYAIQKNSYKCLALLMKNANISFYAIPTEKVWKNYEFTFDSYEQISLGQLVIIYNPNDDEKLLEICYRKKDYHPRSPRLPVKEAYRWNKCWNFYRSSMRLALLHNSTTAFKFLFKHELLIYYSFEGNGLDRQTALGFILNTDISKLKQNANTFLNIILNCDQIKKDNLYKLIMSLKEYTSFKFLFLKDPDFKTIMADKTIPLDFYFKAISEGEPDDIVLMRFILENTDYLNKQDTAGNTALHRAVAASNIELVKELLKYGADVTILNDKAQTCLGLPNIGDGIKKIVQETTQHSSKPKLNSDNKNENEIAELKSEVQGLKSVILSLSQEIHLLSKIVNRLVTVANQNSSLEETDENCNNNRSYGKVN